MGLLSRQLERWTTALVSVALLVGLWLWAPPVLTVVAVMCLGVFWGVDWWVVQQQREIKLVLFDALIQVSLAPDDAEHIILYLRGSYATFALLFFLVFSALWLTATVKV